MRRVKQLQATMDVEQLKEYLAAGGKASWGGRARNGKFNNEKPIHDGKRYDSRAELQFKFYLDILKAEGYLIWYTQQVPFWLPGGKKYKVDFQVVLKTGAIRLVDVKGYETDVFKIKQSVIQSTHGIVIEALPAETDGRYSWR